ncbi:MAG: hypothetical protein KDC85_09205 [Saprospiraceae bacterium]|nr:hypothetical protein [Saprospiraceae bacterium]MCB9326669.1 hypothetical protein [Lewinellaceae bacterium]
MKKLLLVLVLNAVALWGFGQHETLFNHVKVRGAFGGPIIESGFKNSLGNSVGGGGGLVFNNMFIGGYGMGSVDFEKLINDELEVLDIGHGGLWIGGSLPTYKMLHFYGSTRIGWGAVNVQFDNVHHYNDLDKIFVLTPEIGLEMNITHWFRIAASAGYRWVDGTNETLGYNDDDFSGYIGALTFRFGWFGWKRGNW